MRLDADDPCFLWRPPDSTSQLGSCFLWPCLAFGNASGLRSVNAIWELFVVLPLSVNASRIGEQFFEFLRRLGRLAFYIPQLSINVVSRFPCILPGALDLSLHGISALVPGRLGANSLKALAQLYRCLLRLLSCNFTRCDSR